MTTMNRFVRCAWVALLSFSAYAQTIPGSTPPAGETSATTHVVRFQGKIPDGAAGSVNLTFALYANEAGGTALWSESQNVALDATGAFTTLLGAGTAGGLSPNLFVADSARWVGVAVTGQAEQPRVLLVSVPYAMKSVDAERLGGHDVNEFVLQSQLSGGSGTGSSSSTTSSGIVVEGASLVSGSTGFIAKFSAPDSVDDSEIFQGGTGQLAIGKTSFLSTDTKLEINGRMRVDVTNTGASDTTTSLATFTNSVNPTVNQNTATHQSFISSVRLLGLSKVIAHANAGLFETDDFGTGSRQDIFGSNSVVYAGGASAITNLFASNHDAENEFGTVSKMAAIRAGTISYGPGTTTDQIGAWIVSGSNQSGNVNLVTNNYGVLIDDQAGVGTNNWAIKTGTGLVQFGDKTLLAASSASGSSLNLPSGAAPSSPASGDLWNESGSIKFYNGSTQTLATMADLSGGVTSFNGRTGAVSPANSDYSFSQISGTASTGQGGTGVGSSGAAGNYLRSNGATWASSSIQAADIPNLSSAYVDLASVQVVGGSKSFSSAITPASAGGSGLGSGTLPFSNVVIGDAATNNITLTGTATAARTVTLPNATGTLLYSVQSANTAVIVPAVNLAKNQCSGGTSGVSEPTFAVTGAAAGMLVLVTPNLPLGSVYSLYSWQGYVSSPGNVAIHLCNATITNASGATPQSFSIRLIQ